MKKYALFNKDLSTLASEVESYLLANGADSLSYKMQLYHRIGEAKDLVNDIPSITSAFGSEELTIDALGHWCVDNSIRGIPAGLSLLIVPLKNTENCKFNVHEAAAGTEPYVEPVTGHKFYSSVNITLAETIDINGPILVNKDTIYSIEHQNLDLAEFLLIAFSEDISNYFA